MRIRSQIMLRKSLSAKRKDLCEVMYFVNLVRRRLFEILVKLLFRDRIISYLNKKIRSKPTHMGLICILNL